MNCPICNTGVLTASALPAYLRCTNCLCNIAGDMNPRPPEQYDEVEWYGPRWEFGLAVKRLAGINSIVELGCGEGFFAAAIIRPGLKYIGVDFNTRAIATARQRIPESNVCFTASLQAVAQPGDALVAFHVLEHIPNLREALLEILRHSNPRIIIISVPSPHRVLVKYSLRESWDQPPHHLYHFTQSGLAILFRSLNYSLTNTEFEPLRNDEVNTLLENKIRIPKYARKVLSSAFSLVPRSMRPKIGQAMMMTFTRGR
ncbi:methyltransferase domain-containing protein [uncultured Lamprocystis sp.]|jgi:SAM-dependent methyltransferase|uniref:methyltransferase n=1 Tax=uncultured Lamprocystis sp. TaxID=543132 RepID=UPI0026010D90|nr:methyltransferase domain-containing protein [uncultured Lamprocystis sp.]